MVGMIDGWNARLKRIRPLNNCVSVLMVVTVVSVPLVSIEHNQRDYSDGNDIIIYCFWFCKTRTITQLEPQIMSFLEVRRTTTI
jgi:hypothetical protein